MQWKFIFAASHVNQKNSTLIKTFCDTCGGVNVRPCRTANPGCYVLSTTIRGVIRRAVILHARWRLRDVRWRSLAFAACRRQSALAQDARAPVGCSFSRRNRQVSGIAISRRQLSIPSCRSVAMLRSMIASASGYASTARSTLASRSRCSIGNGERLVQFSTASS